MRAPSYSADPNELFGAAAIDDPHALYRRLRRECPLSRVGETGVHLVATWDGIEEALGREADFSANITGALLRGDGGEPATFEFPETAATQVIATADEPSHAVHRALVQPRLAAGRAPALEEPVRRWTRESLAAWLDGGAGDFVPLAESVPARVVAEVLGLPSSDVSRFRTWSMMGGDILAGDFDHAGLAVLSAETQRMADYLGEHFDAACADPRPDAGAPLLHALARGTKRGEISREEAVGIAAVMFGAGGESTAALIASVARCLAEHPELAARLRADESLIPRFVEEVARLEPPFKFHYRAVRRHCELAGFELGPGDRLMLLWASANRDEDHIEDPDTLRLDRRHPKNHLSFGRGAHFCIGAPFARLEARVVCEELLRAADEIALSDSAPPVYAPSIFVRRHERLPLEVGRRATLARSAAGGDG